MMRQRRAGPHGTALRRDSFCAGPGNEPSARRRGQQDDAPSDRPMPRPSVDHLQPPLRNDRPLLRWAAPPAYRVESASTCDIRHGDARLGYWISGYVTGRVCVASRRSEARSRHARPVGDIGRSPHGDVRIDRDRGHKHGLRVPPSVAVHHRHARITLQLRSANTTYRSRCRRMPRLLQPQRFARCRMNVHPKSATCSREPRRRSPSIGGRSSPVVAAARAGIRTGALLCIPYTTDGSSRARPLKGT